MATMPSSSRRTTLPLALAGNSATITPRSGVRDPRNWTRTKSRNDSGSGLACPSGTTAATMIWPQLGSSIPITAHRRVCGDRHLQQQRNAQCRPLESSADIYIILSKSGPGRGAAAPRKGGADCAMTATESAERALFASTAAEFLDKEASLRTVRELHAADQSFEPGWWRRATELGWTSLLVSDDLGGGSVSGNGVADLALIAARA